jgi:diguanylate cyclase (GGDEF)-like protein
LRLRNSVRASDVLCRLGGDEFVILLQDVTDGSTAYDAAEKIRREILEPLHIDGNTVSVGCSIGVSLYPDHSRGYPELLRVADQAMYAAKRGGKGRVRMADEARVQIDRRDSKLT